MKSTNPILRKEIIMLERLAKKENAKIWDLASEMLSRSSSVRAEVNVGKISRVANDGSIVFVPGKVLGGGIINKKVIVGAHSFSSQARKKIIEAGGEAIGIEEFLNRYKDGSGVIIVS